MCHRPRSDDTPHQNRARTRALSRGAYIRVDNSCIEADLLDQFDVERARAAPVSRPKALPGLTRRKADDGQVRIPITHLIVGAKAKIDGPFVGRQDVRIARTIDAHIFAMVRLLDFAERLDPYLRERGVEPADGDVGRIVAARIPW